MFFSAFICYNVAISSKRISYNFQSISLFIIGCYFLLPIFLWSLYFLRRKKWWKCDIKWSKRKWPFIGFYGIYTVCSRTHKNLIFYSLRSFEFSSHRHVISIFKHFVEMYVGKLYNERVWFIIFISVVCIIQFFPFNVKIIWKGLYWNMYLL